MRAVVGAQRVLTASSVMPMNIIIVYVRRNSAIVIRSG
jgi:hypothetical protein